MTGLNLSIRSTLLFIIGMLSVLIAGQTAFNVYQSVQNHIQARELQEVSRTLDLLFSVKKNLSRERAASVGLLHLPSGGADLLMEDLKLNRLQGDGDFKTVIRRLSSIPLPELRDAILKAQKSHAALQRLRQRVDADMETYRETGDSALAEDFFEAATVLIQDVQALIEIYSQPFFLNNPAAARQLRFSQVIWEITEYAGREYAILGRAIAEDKFLSEEEREVLRLWQGRVQYGWELAHSVARIISRSGDIAPLLAEAETHYFMTFEQIKDIFRRPEGEEDKPQYPVTVAMWMELAAQAVGSLYALNDSVLRMNQDYVRKMERDAERGIVLSLLLFAAALLLGFYSWRVIMSRVVRPVNSMVNALYKATRGEDYEIPRITAPHDEIGKLATVMEAFRENSRQLAEERDKAQAANVAKSEFLANMSHEIRTPMNVVLGLANILYQSKPLTENQREYIGTLRMSAESLLSVINDVMDFSKLETHAFQLERIPFSLRKVLDEIYAIMSVKAKEKGLYFEMDNEDVDCLDFIGDPARIRQVITNLCSNAVKFTEKGGVRVAVVCDPHPTGEYADIRIDIADTGIGIPADKLDLIFDKFTQADSSISRKYGGTGLGLAIARAFVEMMGGKIDVKSEPGKGAVFTVSLSLTISPREKSQGGGEKPEPKTVGDICPAADAKVLLVEDYAPNALVAEAFLEKFGFDFDTVETGAEAVEKVKSNRYHAVLMDVQMHGMDGYQATREIRRFEKEAAAGHVRIIGVTAHAMPGDREKCLEAGMDDYLSKPFSSEELHARLSMCGR